MSIIKFEKTNSMGLRLILFLSLILILTSCAQQENEYYSFSGFAQGTTYSVIYNSECDIDPLSMKVEIDSLLMRFDYSLSTYNENSLITALNNGIDVVPDFFMMEVFNRAKEISRLSDGAFDITMGPLINAWGFGPDAQRRFKPQMLDSLMQLVGMDKISISEDKISKMDKNMYIDVNAIAQGYSVDVICDYLISRGVERCLAEVGGEVRTIGSKYSDKAWQVAIDKPKDNNHIPGADIQAIMKLNNKSLATSGNYRKFYVGGDGVKYSHTIDPLTGSPVQHNLLSATIITNDCISADAFATVCMVLGLEKSKLLLNKYDFLEGYLIYSDDNGEFRTWYTEDMITYIAE
jgi:thiamine biosynthesis lipoprotein